MGVFMASEVINVGKTMRKEAWLKVGKRKTKQFRVSPEAIQQMLSYIVAGIEINLPQICERVQKTNHPNTVKEEDVVRYFDFAGNSVFQEGEEINEE